VNVATSTHVGRLGHTHEFVEGSTRAFEVAKAKRQHCGLESPLGAQMKVAALRNDGLRLPDNR
jgi:hypothetical protein